MKLLIKLALIPLIFTFSPLTSANQTEHWVCETEVLYRALLSARLYGVGKAPEQGCRRLPVGQPIEQLSCRTTDFELCQYRLADRPKDQLYWGSPIIKPLEK